MIFVFCRFFLIQSSPLLSFTKCSGDKSFTSLNAKPVKMQKTKIMCNIPVLPVAASILDKYKDVAECTGKLLPVLCNQRMNSYLKEIADVCGIHKNLSTHTARHSYATSICLANGVSMENVAKMLGHADTSVTKHYARVLDQNILKDMQKVNSCLSELAI